MRVAELDYDLPPELIAQAPATAREAARLMRVPELGPIAHTIVGNLAEHVAPGTLIVVNDTRVMRARILGVKDGTGGRAEVFLVRKVGDDTDDTGPVQRWHAMGRSSKPLRPGSRVVAGPLVITFEGKSDEGLFVVAVTARDGASIDAAIHDAGVIPLPPYIKRDAQPEDEERYQTVYAKHLGAVAAPTAGLHMTTSLLSQLETRGCEIASCTLHVGLGTFQPVTVADFDQHPMHSEDYEVSPALADAVARARAKNVPVLAIGTTVVRTLEAAKDPERPRHLRAGRGSTRLLIQPGYRFGVVDRLFSNFHLPRSTLLALVSAFAGIERVRTAYAAAVAEKYRFFSYGDAMLLDRAEAIS